MSEPLQNVNVVEADNATAIAANQPVLDNNVGAEQAAIELKEEATIPIAPESTIGPAGASQGIVEANQTPLDSRYSALERHAPIPGEPAAHLVEPFENSQINEYNKAALQTTIDNSLGQEEAAPEGTSPEGGEAKENADSTQDSLGARPPLEPLQPIPEALVPESPKEFPPLVETAPEAMKENLNILPTREERAQGFDDLNELLSSFESDEQRIEFLQSEIQKYAQGGGAASEEGGGALEATFKVIDYIFAPAMAPGAAIAAPLANPAHTGSFLGDVWANAGIAGQAFNERAFRWFDPDGGTMPDYGTSIVENYLPGIPEEYRGSAGMVVELLLDPTILFGAGLAKGMRRSIQQTARMNQNEDFAGLMTNAVYNFMGWTPEGTQASRVADTAARQALVEKDENAKELLALAERVDKFGDKEAFVELNLRLSKFSSKVDNDEQQAIDLITTVLKGEPNSKSFLIEAATKADGAIDDQALRQSIDTNQALNKMKFNLNKVNDAESFETTFAESAQHYYDEFNTFMSKTNAETKLEGEELLKFNTQQAQKQNDLLADYMGKDLHNFDPAEAYAFRKIAMSSMEQMTEYVTIMNSGVASPVAKDVARIAFYKQFLMHSAIQGKISGVESAAGQFLQSLNIVAC